jgi:hypothetical protein
MDLDNLNSHRISHADQEEARSDVNKSELNKSDDVEDAEKNEDKVFQIEQEINKVNRDDQFKIHNTDLAQNFMKSRQYGRENTPVRKIRNRTQKNLSKLHHKIGKKATKTKNVWDDESMISGSVSLSTDRVEAYDTPRSKRENHTSRSFFVK